MRTLLSIVFLAAVPSAAVSDSVRGNLPIVAASHDGVCYAKSIPNASFGTEGTTTIFAIEEKQDRLIGSFPWYSQDIHLACGVYFEGKSRTIVVRMGPWPQGHRASHDQLALEIFSDGELLASYSTLDIAGEPRNVEASVSHYLVLRDVSGFGWTTEGHRFGFLATTIDGRKLFFRPEDGEMEVIGDDP